MLKDMRGVEISVGNYIVYGKSSRHNPVNLGTVVSIENDEIEVLGDGNSKTGKLSSYNICKRVLVLPESYKES